MIVLVAFDVEGETKEDAQHRLCRALPGVYTGMAKDGIECWWIAEDNRVDGSDNDSAVFVNPGAQLAAYDWLHSIGLTGECNDPRRSGWDEAQFEAPSGESVPSRLLDIAEVLDEADDPRIVDWAVGALRQIAGVA